jgi:hypothetical protein
MSADPAADRIELPRMKIEVAASWPLLFYRLADRMVNKFLHPGCDHAMWTENVGKVEPYLLVSSLLPV